MPAIVNLTTLPLGGKLKNPIFDDRQMKLVAAGLELTDELLAALRRRGVRNVFVNDNDLPRVAALQPQGHSKLSLPFRSTPPIPAESEFSERLEDEADANPAIDLRPSLDPFADRLKPRSSGEYDRDLSNLLIEQNESRVESLTQSLDACRRGDGHSLAGVVEQSAPTFAAACEDLDVFVCLGINPHGSNYPSRHSLHTAMLAAAIGTNLRLGAAEINDLVTGCLIHDLGMLLIDPRVLRNPDMLDDQGFSEISKHPLKTFDLLMNATDMLSANARMVAYQIHERCNGSGYPRNRPMFATHYLARIAAVADVYVALVSPRLHRKALLPYAAIEQILKGVRQGLFDVQVVRALLETVGLFPIGSFVAINDQYVGRVIRSNGSAYDRPICQLWRRGNLTADPSVVDLSQERAMRVNKPLASLGI